MTIHTNEARTFTQILKRPVAPDLIGDGLVVPLGADTDKHCGAVNAALPQSQVFWALEVEDEEKHQKSAANSSNSRQQTAENSRNQQTDP